MPTLKENVELGNLAVDATMPGAACFVIGLSIKGGPKGIPQLEYLRSSGPNVLELCQIYGPADLMPVGAAGLEFYDGKEFTLSLGIVDFNDAKKLLDSFNMKGTGTVVTKPPTPENEIGRYILTFTRKD